MPESQLLSRKKDRAELTAEIDIKSRSSSPFELSVSVPFSTDCRQRSFTSKLQQLFSGLMGDPKAFDNTPQQAEKYQERSLQIATEMFYVFSKIKSY